MVTSISPILRKPHSLYKQFVSLKTTEEPVAPHARRFEINRDHHWRNRARPDPLCWGQAPVLSAGNMGVDVDDWCMGPIPSHGGWYIYLHLADFCGFHVGKYTIHGSYGFGNVQIFFVFKWVCLNFYWYCWLLQIWWEEWCIFDIYISMCTYSIFLRITMTDNSCG